MTSRIPVVENILSANDRMAERNRFLLDQVGVYSINIMASPGAGKTSLILKTLESLNGRLKLGVVEGDLATSIDAEKAAAAGLPAEAPLCASPKAKSSGWIVLMWNDPFPGPSPLRDGS
jgi:hydrogenase nickel incorporation protein HypB